VNRVLIGRLGRPHALAGGLKYRSDEPALLLRQSRVYLEGLGWRAIERVEELPAGLVVYFVGASDREAAEELADRDVYLEAESLPALQDGWYYFQLLGLPVLLDGRPWGEVVDVIDNGAQDVLVVSGASGRFMVPLQAPYVEIKGGQVRLSQVPTGLLG